MKPPPKELGVDSSARWVEKTILSYGCCFPGYSLCILLIPRAQILQVLCLLRNMKKKMRCIKWELVLSTALTWYATAWISFSGFAFHVCINQMCSKVCTNQMCSDFADGKDSHIYLWKV